MNNDFIRFIFLNFGKTAGIILGFLLALSLIFFGLLRTLLIIALVVLGFIIGKWFDEGVNLRKFLKDLMESISENKLQQ
jgi:uncharacterized membrane protein